MADRRGSHKNAHPLEAAHRTPEAQPAARSHAESSLCEAERVYRLPVWNSLPSWTALGSAASVSMATSCYAGLGVSPTITRPFAPPTMTMSYFYRRQILFTGTNSVTVSWLPVDGSAESQGDAVRAEWDEFLDHCDGNGREYLYRWAADVWEHLLFGFWRRRRKE